MLEIIIGFVVGVLSNLVTNFIWEEISRRGGISTKPRQKQTIKGWLEVVGWGIIPIFFTLSALLLVQYRWPLDSLGKTMLLIGSFCLAIAFVVGIRYLSLQWSPKQTLVALVTVGFGLALFAFYLLDSILPNFIVLECPSRVRTITTLQGRVIDPRWRVFVLVWPRRSSGAWVNRASPPGKDGTWYATCSFGGGDGDLFEVYALALPPELVKSITSDTPLPKPEWLENFAPHKTSICVITKKEQ